MKTLHSNTSFPQFENNANPLLPRAGFGGRRRSVFSSNQTIMQKQEIIQRLDALEQEAITLRKALSAKTGTIIERVKTFEDVCNELGITVEEALPYDESLLMTPDRVATNAFVKVSLIAKVLNEGWVPNWDDSNEYKYYPWFDMRNGSGSGFSSSGYLGSSYGTTVGSRLCFKSSELVEYASKQFETVYKQLFTIV
jgi:hypothetical protein